MCEPCEASKERLQAATALRDKLECPQGYGISAGLKQVYRPAPLEDEWLVLASKFNL